MAFLARFVGGRFSELGWVDVETTGERERVCLTREDPSGTSSLELGMVDSDVGRVVGLLVVEQGVWFVEMILVKITSGKRRVEGTEVLGEDGEGLCQR